MLYLWSAPKEVIAINKFESGKVASFEFVTEVVTSVVVLQCYNILQKSVIMVDLLGEYKE